LRHCAGAAPDAIARRSRDAKNDLPKGEWTLRGTCIVVVMAMIVVAPLAHADTVGVAVPASAVERRAGGDGPVSGRVWRPKVDERARGLTPLAVLLLDGRVWPWWLWRCAIAT
jgi:hypothetical protein